ncbi:MAG: hypothetical protein IKD10_12120 [Lentisphaeria bacterium]|nr:hypothetical protein [Lentisphaeria bacterium]
MITENTIYWILKLDDITGLLIVITIIAAAVSTITFVLWGMSDSDDNKDHIETVKKLCVKSIVIALICGLGLTFIPRTKQMAMIKIIPMIANSEIVGEMSTDCKELYRMGIKAMKEQLTDTTR